MIYTKHANYTGTAMFKKTLILLPFLYINIQAHVLIFTTAYNRPDFIALQHKSLVKYLKDDFEYVVFNDAAQIADHTAIVEECEKLNIKCIDFPQYLHVQPQDPYLEIHVAPCRHAQVIQYAFDTLGFKHNDIVAILDADLFLVEDFSIRNYMQGYDIAGSEKNGIIWSTFSPTNKYTFLWPILLFLDMSKLPDKHTMKFEIMNYDNHYFDSCGSLYFYLRDHPSIKIKKFDVVNLNAITHALAPAMFTHYHHNKTYYTLDDTQNRALLEQLNFKNREIKFIQSGPINIQYFLDNKFFHYMSASNYDKQTENFHLIKTQLFNEYMDKVLN